MSDRLSLCYLYFVLEEIKYYSDDIYEMIKEYVYINALLTWNTKIICSKQFHYVKNFKMCKLIREMEYGSKFIPMDNSYHTKIFLNTTSVNFNSFNTSYLSEIDFKYTSLTKLPTRLFTNSFYKKVILPQNLKKIPLECFYKSNIKEVIINNKCECIETNAFYLCRSLTRIIIPENVKQIKFKAFYNSGLVNVLFQHKEKSSITFYKNSFINDCLKKKNFRFINKSINVNYKSSKKECLSWK